jgi:hypothetical protein
MTTYWRRKTMNIGEARIAQPHLTFDKAILTGKR